MASIYDFFTRLYYSVVSLFYQQELQVVILGFPNSGKSTFVNALIGNQFANDTIPTIGVDVEYFKLDNLILKIFDTSGQERFQSTLWKTYQKKADLIIYVLDLSDKLTLDDSKRKLIQILIETNDRNVPILILGNKADLMEDTDFIELAKASDPKEQQITNNGSGKSGNGPSQSEQLNRVQKFSDFIGLKQESLEKFILRRAVSNPHVNDVANTPDAAATKKSNKKMIIEHNEEEILEFYRDIGIFTISCKEREHIEDVLSWIVGR